MSITETKGYAGAGREARTLAGLAPVLFVVVAFLFWGGRTLWDTSEARYGQVAFEMLRSGHWLVPSLAAEPHLTKPPLTYWLIGSGMKLFGINAWGARFFLSAAFLATILAVRELAATLGFDRRQAAAAALIFATGAIPFAGGHTLTTDGFLVLWETLGVLAAWKVWRGASADRTFWRHVFWGSFGLAFFTKGPPGWMPLLVIAVFLLLRRRRERPRLTSATGFALFLVVSFWWYGYMLWQNRELLSYFMVDEVYNRIFTAAHRREEPFWYYLPILAAGVGPWLILWPGLGRRAWRSLAARRCGLSDWQLFAMLWVLIPLVILTIAKSKMVFYVLPLFVPISLAMSKVLTDDLLPLLRHHSLRRRAGWGLALLWGAVLVVYTGGLDFFAPGKSMRPAATAFAGAVATYPEGPHIHWVWAGRQRYSLAFYMQQVIEDMKDPAIGAAATAVPDTSLYVTSEEGLQVMARTARNLFPSGAPYVLARAQGYVLFARQQPEQRTGGSTGLAAAGGVAR